MDAGEHDPVPPANLVNEEMLRRWPEENKKSCTWRSHIDYPLVRPQRQRTYVKLWVMPYVESIFDSEAHQAGKENVISVSDIGDKAYFATYGGAMTVLNVKKGDIHVQLTYIGYVGAMDQQSVLDAEKSIVSQVLSEL